MKNFEGDIFTDDQLKEIKELGVECAFSSGGYHKNLSWGFFDDGLYVHLKYKAKDIDGDWGYAGTCHYNISFKELLDTIKNTYSHFDTRNWN